MQKEFDSRPYSGSEAATVSMGHDISGDQPNPLGHETVWELVKPRPPAVPWLLVTPRIMTS